MIEYERVKAVISLDNIRENVNNLKKFVPDDTKVMLIIKADGYGHGAREIAEATKDICYAYGVAIIDEAVTLREQGVDKMILVLSYTPESYLKVAVQYGISLSVSDYETAKLMSDEAVKAGLTAKIHIKLDTGMGRLGFRCTDEDAETIKKISELPNVCMEGLFTHFSKADETDLGYTEKQFEKYSAFAAKLEEMGVTFVVKHVCNSAAVIQFSHAALDMVRFGIALYGLYPSEDIDKNAIKLLPAMSIEAKVSYVKTVPPGTYISYGGTYVSPSDRVIATIPVGYADGYPRALSGNGRVLINGQYAPIVGRVCMDQFMVDVTDIGEVKRGDKVVLLGRYGDNEITAEELSAPGNSFNYEFVCGVNKRVPREYNV